MTLESVVPACHGDRMTSQQDTSLQDIALMRLVAQRLAGPRAPTAADAVSRLAAVQGQDLPGARTQSSLPPGSASTTEPS